MRIKFWGVRGGAPSPERRNSRYGGNTSCIEVRLANGTLIIFDCGTGIRALGRSLIREFKEYPVHAFIFLTHYHWDHIQGIPFFDPLYKEGNNFVFYSVPRGGFDVKQIIEGQFGPPYFPASEHMVKSNRYYYDLKWQPVNLNGAVITCAPLNHPQGCAGYRLEADGSVLVVATDTEPGSPFHDRRLRELAQGAETLVYDAQYTPEKLAAQKKGLGHSSWLEGTEIARACKVQRLVLFHHDPESDDTHIDQLVAKARGAFSNVIAAAEGMEIQLPRGELAHPRVASGTERRRERRFRLELPVRLSWRAEDGHAKVARGRCLDFSRSGIHFLAPEDIETDLPVDLELILPEEITHQDDLPFAFEARVVRRESAAASLGAAIPTVEVAARLTVRRVQSAQHAA